MNTIRKMMCALLVSAMGIGTMNGTTAAKGIFTVANGKTVQFADANEPDLVQWSDAYAWREDKKNEEGHNGWYVLNHEEWTYLMSDGGRTNATEMNSLATVAGDSGLVILPDNWVKPEGVPRFKPVTEGIDYKNNVYTTAQWNLMEKSGAVFLPCEGYSEDGEAIINATDHGRYWASDAYDTDDGYTMSMQNGIIHDHNNSDKDLYYSVILVKEVTVPELYEEDEAAAYNTHWTAAKTKDFAIVNRTMYKNGTLHTLCLPFDVPNVDASPLAGAEIFTFEGGRVSGAAGSEVLYLTLSRLEGKRMTQGVPYVLRWVNTGETISKLCFYNVENWDDNTTADTIPESGTIKLCGLYPKTHITDYTSGVDHYHFFIGANNTLYWPDNSYTHAEGHDMKGFRAYFYITSGGGPDPAAPYRGMQAVWEIPEEGWGVESIQHSAISIQKELHEGQIVLIIDGERYDVTGKKL